MGNNLVVEQLSKKFGSKHVLDDISFTLEPEKIYGLLGRNGVGKSTLLNLLNGRLEADHGQILLGDQPVTRQDELLGQLFLAGEPLLLTTLSGLNVKKILNLMCDFYPDFDLSLAEHLLEVFQLAENTKLTDLSTGYHSVLKIVIGLAVPADYIFLDEPLLGLDAANRELFYQELLATYSQRPRTFVLASHLVAELRPIIEEVIILSASNQLFAEGTDSLLSRSLTVTGPRQLVERETAAFEVLDSEHFGTQSRYHLLHPEHQTPVFSAELQVQPLNLQDLFIQLTKKERLS